MTRRLGWIPDLKDHRDFEFKLSLPASRLPPKYEMKMPFVYDQGMLGSCTAQATAAAYQFTEIEQDGDAPIPSRLALYYWTRKEIGTIEYDSGAGIRDAIKAAAKYGVCREALWPYDTSKFKRQPNANAMAEAAKRKLGNRHYARVSQSLPALKSCLASNNPIIFGFSVYDSFLGDQVRRTGILEMPKESERLQGGHAVLLIGYDDERKAFLVKNSWGQHWGLRGNFWMPYTYVISSRLSSDFWTIYKVAPLS